MKTKKKKICKRSSSRILDRIEALVAEAYEIGHDHGDNAMRIALRLPPLSLDRGWEPISDEIQRMFKMRKQ